MEGDFGWILKGLMGAASVSPAGSLTQAGMVDDGSLTVTGNLTIIDATPPATQRLALTVNAGLVGDAAISISGINGSTPINEICWLTAVGTTMTNLNYTEVYSITVVNTAGTGTLDVGWYTGAPYVHTFKFASSAYELPWMTVRKHIPGTAALGEVFTDCKVGSVRFTFPQRGIVQARTDWIGITPAWDESPGSWTYSDAFEGPDSVPVSSVTSGFVKFPASGGALPITNLQVIMTNNLTTAQQEAIIGSPYMDDITTLSRAMTIQALLKWNDPDMYQYLLTNAAAGTSWSPTPFSTTFDCKVLAPNTPYYLRAQATLVAWSMQQAPVLGGGDLIMLPMLGQVLAPPSGEYATFDICNSQVNYT